ncbi:MAG: hypothetical protein JWO60_482, partial [Frankiales bacterium]|nr:hypothetical protein [Frankiales bacterium]
GAGRTAVVAAGLAAAGLLGLRARRGAGPAS